MYFLRLAQLRIAGASPEVMVRLEHGDAVVRPIAGTRPRGADEAEDRASSGSYSPIRRSAPST